MNSAQREKVDHFVGVTGADDKTATSYLTNAGWKLDQAMNAYYDQASNVSTANTGKSASKSTNSSSVDKNKLNKIFDNYKDADEDAIGPEGTEKLCDDLDVDPTDVVTLVMAYHLKCENMCEFKRNGWIEGWSKLQCETMNDMKQALVAMRSDLNDPVKFKEIYLFTFNFAKGENQKSLEKETAVGFWTILFTGKYKFIDKWLKFLEEHNKSIPKDTWVQFLDFSQKYSDSFEGYEDDGAWPVLIDEFVEFVQAEDE